MVILLLLVALVVSIAAVIFAIGNPGVVSITILTWQLNTSLTLLVLVAFVLGFVVALLLLLPGMIRLRYRVAVHKKEIKDLKKSVPEAKTKIESKDNDNIGGTVE